MFMNGLLLGFLGFLVRIPLCLIFYGTPLLGFWLASSLAAYMGGPHYLPWVAGFLLFPILPGLWELQAHLTRRKDSKPFLTTLDRISLRTFAIGLLFLVVLLGLYPQTAFVSLSTRGDWMLDDVKDARADKVRPYLFAAANGVEWLYKASRKNPFKDQIDQRNQQLAQEAAKQLALQQVQQQQQQQEETSKNDEQKQDSSDEEIYALQAAKNLLPPEVQDSSNKSDGKKPQKKDEQKTDEKPGTVVAQAQEEIRGEKKWPWNNYSTLHPAVVSMPPEVETSIKSVAKYIAKKEKDPVMRIKALHDYVADRVAYDADSYYAGVYPSQDAEVVFKTHKSVCAGYANLLSALAAAIGEKIIVVGGDARDDKNGDKLTGEGHAWNAAFINNKWWLMDVTWDSGSVSREKGFTKEYRTNYFLLPPEVMIQDHYPDEQTWQLLAKPLSQGEFLRQPMLRPSFQAADLKLISPRRVRNEVGDSTATVILKNPDHLWLMAGLEQNGRDLGPGTEPNNNESVVLEMPLPAKGTYRMNMFLNKKQYGSFSYVGAVDFVNR